jgi:hypothetical protein
VGADADFAIGGGQGFSQSSDKVRMNSSPGPT